MADMTSGEIDAGRIAAVCAALGRQRLRELMRLLHRRIESLAAAAEMFPDSAEDFLAALHQSRGSAASLGLIALAEGLAVMEAEARRALRQAHAIGAVRQAGRALPSLWRDAAQAQDALLFLKKDSLPAAPAKPANTPDRCA